MDASSPTPELRFQGFQEPWKKKCLEDLIIRGGSGGTPTSTVAEYYGGTIPFLSITDITNSGSHISDTQKHLTEEGLNACSAWIVPSGSLSLAMYASVGKVAILDTEVATSQAFYNMVFEDTALRDFCFAYLKKIESLNGWAPLISTGTQANLNAEKVKSFPIPFPQEEGEREKIGAFFEKLDKDLTHQEAKLERLKRLKTSCLAKFFPKEGSSVPGLRFPGFTEPWKQVKLGACATFGKGAGYSKNDLCPSGTPIILYGRLYTKYQTIIQEIDTFVLPRKSSIFSKGGEVIVPASGETAEDIARASVVAQAGILLGGDLHTVKPDRTVDPTFLALTLSHGHVSNTLAKRAQGKTVVHIHKEDLEQLAFFKPSLIEQEKIGEFFTKLDALFALQEQKVEWLRRVKSTFLGKLFI